MPPLVTDNFRSPAALARFAATTAVGLAIDLWTKSFAFEQLATSQGAHPLSRTCQFIPGMLHFMVTTNTGAVFGLGEGQRFLFISVSVAAILFITFLFATSGNQRFYQFILGMLLAGVLGNMYDRIVFSYVRDMIHALPNWQWPGGWTIPLVGYPFRDRFVFPWIFNVADVLLCTGVGLMLLYSVLYPRRPQEPVGAPPKKPAADR